MNIDFHGDSAARAAFLHSQTALNSTIGKIFYDTQTDLAYISDGVAFDGGHTLAQVGLGGGGGGISAEAEVVDNTGTFIYEGYAAFGSATSAAVWKIRRSAISGTVIGPMQRADGNDNYDNVWDNRAALSYS